jgi:phenylalanine-4-hydroxylase
MITTQLVSQNYSSYCEEDYDTWEHLLQRQLKLLDGRACREFISGINEIIDFIQVLPKIEEVSECLNKNTGWKLQPVKGLLGSTDYFHLLSNRIFPVAISIRRKKELDRAPYPDIWHDIFGHLPLLFSPQYSSYVEYMSGKMLAANSVQRQKISRLYWYTIEAGVIRENNQRRVYGAAQLSSFEEIDYAINGDPTVLEFDLEKLIQSPGDDKQLQSTIFEISSFDYLDEIKAGIDWIMKHDFQEEPTHPRRLELSLSGMS